MKRSNNIVSVRFTTTINLCEGKERFTAIDTRRKEYQAWTITSNNYFVELYNTRLNRYFKIPLHMVESIEFEATE